MKRIKNIPIVRMAVILMMGNLFFGCTDNEDQTAGIRFFLTDMPAEYQQVNVEVLGVQVMVNDSLMELTTNQGVYNLLELANGKDTLLVDDRVPSGTISQIRLILGENNNIMMDSVLHSLKTPSAQQSGLKLNIHNEFLPGEYYEYMIDFQVDKSVVETGNGNLILKPVIRVFTEALTGAIKGVVSPPGSRPYLMAIGNGDSSGTFADTISGKFAIRGLEEGNYSLEVDPLEGFQDTVISDVSVVPGQVTELDTLFIKEQANP